MKNSINSLLQKIMYFAFLYLPFNPAFAQIQVQTGFSHAYDNNPFRLTEQEASWISTFELGLQHDFNTVSLSYEGNFIRFDRLMERNFYWHMFSLFGAGEKTSWGFFIEQSHNSTDYNFYDHLAAVANLDFQFKFRSWTLYWSGNLNYNSYPRIEEINNYLFYTYIRLHKSFPTRTTFIGGTVFSYKYYPYSYAIKSPQMSLLPVLSSWGGGYHGGFGGNEQTFQIYTTEETRYATQIQLWIRLAQAITPSTGVAVQYQDWISLSGQNRSIAGVMYDYNDESSIFDDPHGYELQSIHAEFTQLLPYQFILKLAYDVGNKNYTSQEIYQDAITYNTSILRSDDNKHLNISLQKSINLGEMILDIKLLYRWLNNNSNSYWYNYNSTYIAVLLNWYF
jgi:hypothetical protein